jgi:hypothetical protein
VQSFALLVLIAIALSLHPAAASSPSSPSLFRSADNGTCVKAVTKAAEEGDIPKDLMLAIAVTEAGRRLDGGAITVWPWTVATQDGGDFFERRLDAWRHVESLLSQDRRSVDVGCMQINLRWHPEAFSTWQEAFDPLKNAHYAARFLNELKERHGDWDTAVAHYHSATPDIGQAYLERVTRNKEVLKGGVVLKDADRTSLLMSHTPSPAPVLGGFALSHSPTSGPLLPGYGSAGD